MTVLLVTTWGTACGIACHSATLIDAVHHADPSIDFLLSDHLDPKKISLPDRQADWPQILHLNYHRALHSQWTPPVVQEWKEAGFKIVITFHDTYGEHPPDDLCRDLSDLADAFIVHEPCRDLPKALYWRMGVPAPTPGLPEVMHTAYWQQPILGTVGFPFGWKHVDQLAQISADCGWAFLAIAPGATPEQVDDWRRRNPVSYIRTDFVPQSEVTLLLAGCDATAFTYVTNNSGQSGAILQGIAARKTVIALQTCRQFRAIFLDKIGHYAVRWCDNFEQVTDRLRQVIPQRVDSGIVAFAEQDSWIKLGQKYASLYKDLIGG